MDNKAILAIVLSLSIWVGWQKLYLEPFQKQAHEQAEKMELDRQASLSAQEKAASLTAVPVATESKNKEKAPVVVSEIKESVLSAKNFSAKISNGPELLTGWSLNSYYRDLEKSGGAIDLGLVTGFEKQIKLRFNEPEFNSFNAGVWQEKSRSEFATSALLKTESVEVARTFTTSQTEYFSDLNYSIKFTGSKVPAYVFIDLLGNPHRPNDKEGSILGETPDKVSFAYNDNNGRHSQVASSIDKTIESMSGVRWFGIDTRYFFFGLIPGEQWRVDSGIQIFKGFQDGVPAVTGSLVVATNGKSTLDIPMRVFFGPKKLDMLKATDPALASALDFGWTSFIAVPILSALKWLYNFIGNYGYAIILLTIAIKILLFPLMYKSMKSMSKMAKLQPQLNALREKYKDDKEKLNTEMMNFMKVNGYNPVSGCLPLLAQMPIFFALYRVLFNSIELYQAPFTLWIHDLSRPDPFFVTPVILTGLMYVQQKLSPNTATDPMQQKMLQFMPIMFGMFMLLLPSGLTIYMVINSVMTILQQRFLNVKFGVHTANQAKLGKASA